MFDDSIRVNIAAKLIGVTPKTLRRWDASGKLRPERSSGGHRYYRLSQLQPYLVAIDAVGWLWVSGGQPTKLPDDYYCERQDRFSSRLAKMSETLLRPSNVQSMADLVSLLTLVAGEIGDNSFAHNIGNWPDVPGVFFAYDLIRRLVVLADRGRGVLETLRQVRPSLSTDRTALRVAFTQIISGREPEQRGNGLKVVRRVTETSQITLRFQSGSGVVELARAEGRLRITTSRTPIRGTYAIIRW